METFLIIGGLVIFSLLAIASGVSVFEKEKRAAIIFLLAGVFALILFVLLPELFPGSIPVFFTMQLIILFAAFLLLLPLDFYKDRTWYPESRVDERDTMFSRNELLPGSPEYRAYYERNPELKVTDDNFRSKPGLLSEKSLFYDPDVFAVARAHFDQVKTLYPKISGRVSDDKTPLDAKELSELIKNEARRLGARDAGICQMKTYHWYSQKGRGETYGQNINPEHEYGIAFTVEMDKDHVDAAPHAPIVMESAKQYLESGKIAVELAEKLRSMGYDARAHIDGNYQLVCPLVARDAGLGEIGRMGLLMTPKLGPRVRIAVVTTNAPLQTDMVRPDYSAMHFCEICKKCAVNCPSHSIPFEGRKMINGAKRWQINSESCYTYWCIAGTDCGQCMRVCPYSHGHNFLHDFVRWGIRNSLLFRYAAACLDDFIYGKRPPSKKLSTVSLSKP